MPRPRTTLVAVASAGLMLCGLAASSAVAAEIPGAYIVTLSSGDPSAAAAGTADRDRPHRRRARLGSRG